MIKIWNPIEAYRKASQRSQEAQTRHEANTKICIGDYTDSKGATYTALIIDGIPVQRVTAEQPRLRFRKEAHMDNKEFFDKVAQMRTQQKAFFNRPSSEERKTALVNSKRLEKEIDNEIARVQEIMARKETYLVQYQDVDGSITSHIFEGFDMGTQYCPGMMVANITKRLVTYNGKDWEAMTLFKGKGGNP